MSDTTSFEDDDEEFDPVEAERQIDEFIVSADTLGGASIAALGERAAAVLADTWDRLEEVVGQEANNKVVATMLWLSREARRHTPEDPRQWQLHAASSLVGAMIPNART